MTHITRDPETGQFVSAETGHSVQKWQDYEFQHVHSHYDVDAADLPGGFPIEEENINAVEMDDLLHRDELADLVAVYIHSLQAAIPGTASAESSIEARWELGLGAGSNMVMSVDNDFTADSGDTGIVDHALWESDSPDTLYFANLVAEGSHNDTTNSLAGGADAPVISDKVHFPQEFGTCPVLDDRDEVSESFHIRSPGSSDQSDTLIHLAASYSLVFGITEADRRGR